MKSFIYTYSEGKAPRDGSGIKKTVHVYQLVKGTPKLIATRTDTFVSEFQLVMDAMEQVKALPRKAFEKNPNTGSRIYGTAWALREDGIANINGV